MNFCPVFLNEMNFNCAVFRPSLVTIECAVTLRQKRRKLLRTGDIVGRDLEAALGPQWDLRTEPLVNGLGTSYPRG
jgi:hypothetical protein